MEFYSKAAMEQVMKIQTTGRPTPNLPWTSKSPNPLPYAIVGVMSRVRSQARKCRVHEMYVTYGYTKQSNAIMFAISSIDYIA